MSKLMKVTFKLLDLIVIFAMVFGSPMSAAAKVWTDPTDYPPGSTVWIQGDNSDGAAYQLGETVHVEVVGPLGEDGQPYTASCEDVVEETDPVNRPGYLYWTCSVTLWDSLYAEGPYTYTAYGSQVTEQGTFTDAAGSTNKVYQHWADGDAATGTSAEWNNNILSANKSDYFEGEVIPHVFVYKASNQAPLTNGQSYSFNVTYNYYQQNTNAGGFAYMTTYNISRQPGPNDATNPYIAPTADSTFTNGGGTQGIFYTVDADITNVSSVTDLGTGSKDGYVTITFKYTGTTTTNGIAEVYFGLYIAEPGQVPNQGAGPTKGAADWTGGSLQTTVDIGGSGASSIQLNPAAIIRGQISGMKFNDLNGNGLKDTGEPALSGWTIQLCADSACTTILQTATTDANGVYSFSVTPDAVKSDPDNDPYYVREVNQNGWTQTAPGSLFFGPLTVSSLTPQYLNQNFGNFLNISLSGYKWNDVDGDSVWDAGETGLQNWTIQLDRNNDSTIDATATTDATGKYTFTNLGPGTYKVTELLQSGWTQTYGNAGYIFTASSGQNLAGVSETAGTYNFGNKVTPAPSLSLLKQISTSASEPWSSSITVPGGSQVYYQFTITNTGNAALSTVSVSDPTISGEESCLFTNPLPVGTSTTCVVGPVTAATAAGTYPNTATASGVYSGTTYNSQPSSAEYIVGALPSIDVEKYVSVDGGTTWQDADTTPGPYMSSGTNPQFKFVVINTGNTALSSISLSDSDFNLSGCTVPSTLAIGDSFECVITGSWASGQHTDTATASGSYADTPYSDTDDANYFGASPQIEIQKTPDTQTVIYGQTANFTIVVKNIGNVPLTSVAVDDPLSPDCNETIGDLAVGEEYSYTCSLANVTSSFNNVATASGTYGNTTVYDFDDAAVVVDVLPDIAVTKTANPTSVPESGGDIEFTFVVTNNSTEPFILNSLTDNKFGDLDGQGTCDVPQTIAAGANYTCKITQTLSGQAGTSHVNEVTAAGVDEQGNPDSATDDATVTFTDVAPTVDLTKAVTPSTLAEPGGVFHYTLTIKNNSFENVTITALTDDNSLPAACTDLIGDVLTPGQEVSCSYDVTHTDAGSYPNTASVTIQDNDGSTASDNDSETVTVTDVLPTVTLTKAAAPASLPEPGGEFAFTLTIKNTSVEAVTITALTDDNPLSAECSDLIGDTLAPNQEVSCTYTVTHTNAGTYPNTASVTVKDNENNTAGDSDDETVTVTDVRSYLSVVKSTITPTLPEPGGTFAYQAVVSNPSTNLDPITVSAVVDSYAGDISAGCNVTLPVTLDPGDSFTCDFTYEHLGDYPMSWTNTVTATGTDDEGQDASATSNEVTVLLTDVLPAVTVTKTGAPLSVPETGGNVTFTFVVKNDSTEAATITALSDSKFGVLTGDADCQVGTVLTGGASCSFEATFAIPAGEAGSTHINVFTATVTDGDDNNAADTDDETITYIDVAPAIEVTKTANPTSLPETGGSVTFTYRIANTGPEAVTVTGIVDDKFGSLLATAETQIGGPIIIPATDPDSYFEFTYTTTLASDSLTAHVNRVDVTAVDNDGTSATDWDDETVTFTDVAPLIEVTKTAHPTHVLETGDNVTFTIEVKNIGVEDVTLTSLSDDKFGNLAGQGTCTLPQPILVGGSYTCTVTKFLSSDSLTPHTNVVTAMAVDDDNTPATDTDDETVTFDDVAPVVRVTKTASPTHVPETGGNVTFTFLVENTGVEDVTLTSLTDSVFGDLMARATATVPQTILIGGSYTCSVTEILYSDSLTSHYNVVYGHRRGRR